MTWQPIETAPKDAFKNVLLWDGKQLSLGFFFPEYVPPGAVVQGVPGCWEQAYTLDTLDPTHWMPIPKPPEEE